MEKGTVFFTESKFVENKKFIPEKIEIPIFIHKSIIETFFYIANGSNLIKFVIF